MQLLKRKYHTLASVHSIVLVRAGYIQELPLVCVNSIRARNALHVCIQTLLDLSVGCLHWGRHRVGFTLGQYHGVVLCYSILTREKRTYGVHTHKKYYYGKAHIIFKINARGKKMG